MYLGLCVGFIITLRKQRPEPGIWTLIFNNRSTLRKHSNF